MHLAEQLTRMITSYWVSQAVYAAAKFGIADLLSSGPLSVGALAAKTKTEPNALYRLLRALASVGLFAEGDDRTFSLTPLAELLQTGVPGSQRALALMTGGTQFAAWAEIAHSIQTGQTAFEKHHGQPLFDYLSQHPDEARVFDEAMTGIHGSESAAVLEAYDFSGIGTLADIGGGNGGQLITILEAHPQMQGILFDLPHVAERAKERIAAAGLGDRCQVVGGSFFESIPPGADAYLMRHIIHDWDDEKSRQILGKVRAAIPAQGKLLVVESVIPPGNAPFAGKFLDLTMLLIPGGKERTEQEYRELYQQAGFALQRIVATSTEVSVVEGEPA